MAIYTAECIDWSHYLRARFRSDSTRLRLNSAQTNSATRPATATPPKPARAKSAAAPANGFVLNERPVLAAKAAPPTVPFRYPMDMLPAGDVDVGFRAPVGATAGRPLTGLTSKRILLEGMAAGMALKRMLGTRAVDRDVDEALSVTVLRTVF